jgi:serine/threonine protein kinase
MKQFKCPHCGQLHSLDVSRCPRTEEGISEVYKLEGELLAERYRLKGILSEGGMGVVYEAEHEALGRRVAVKMLHPHLRVSSDTMMRFENEARLAASVGHRCVVDVLDLGRHNGLPYFVMEYLEGEALDDVLERRGTIERREAVDLCLELLEGLKAVHEKGIVHRDLKPGNIMRVQQAGGSRIVKVLDFGISRLQEAEARGLGLTKTGSVFGTPRYMSPEQAKGKKDVDARADLYAVGVLLYRCLTGGFPFTGDNYNALLNAIATADPIPPSERIDGIPEGLEAIIMRSLSRDRRERYQDAAAFIEALAPYSSLPPHVSVPPGGGGTDDLQERPTMVPDRTGEPSGDVSGMATSCTATSGRRWRPELTWLLPLAIVVVLAVAGISVAAFMLHSARSRDDAAMTRMSPVRGSKDRAARMLPDEDGDRAAKQPPGGPPLDGSAAPERILLDLDGLPEGATVELDGRPLPQIPILLSPEDGDHVIRVEAPGYETWEADVSLLSDLDLEVEMRRSSSAPVRRRGGKGVAQPPIDTTYPGMIGKQGKDD